jgi:hypothetical protein
VFRYSEQRKVPSRHHRSDCVAHRLSSSRASDSTSVISSSIVRQGWTRRTRDTFMRHCRPLSFAWFPSPARLRPGHHRQSHHRLRSARRPRNGAYSAVVGLINRPRARLRQARPRARANHRLSHELPLRRPVGPQRRRPEVLPVAAPTHTPSQSSTLGAVTLRLQHSSYSVNPSLSLYRFTVSVRHACMPMSWLFG